MAAGDLPHQRQAQSRTSIIQRAATAEEGLEHALEFRVRHARSLIPHPQACNAVGAADLHAGRRHTVAVRILQQVAQQAAQQARIAVQHGRLAIERGVVIARAFLGRQCQQVQFLGIGIVGQGAQPAGQQDFIEQVIQLGDILFQANASHELRTPLARIRLALELIPEGIDPKRRAGLEQDIAELNELLDEILLASRLGAVVDDTTLEEIDLLALAAEECARYDEAVLDGESAVMQGDPRLLRRLLRNLLENAHRHGKPPANVSIANDGGTARLTVWDDGPGVPEAEFERVFEPFYRRRNTRDNSGAGLGLALVRQIARRHGGEARCVLMADGRSSFEITLPLATPTPK